MQEENTNYTPPVYPADKPIIEESKKTIPTFVGITTIVIVAVILFGGVFAWQYFATKTQNKTAGLPVQRQQATEGWKTYTNNTYNYQISYGSDATIEEIGSDSVRIQYQNGHIEICSTSVGGCGVPEFSEELKAVTKAASKEIIIEGKRYNASGFISNNKEEGIEALYLNLPNNMLVYLVVNIAPNATVERKLLETLSTFKFTK